MTDRSQTLTEQPFRATIPPVSDMHDRPVWSVMIPTYNCAGFLAQALESVLAQDPGPEQIQIEVVDDASTADDPEAVVQAVGKGRVGFYRQPQNVGHVRNFDTCLLRSRGKLVHLLHGDDMVRPGFYTRLQAAFDQHPEIGAAFCRYISMDERGHWNTIWELERTESGILPNWLEKIAAGQRLQPPAIAVRREVYERLGGFDRRIRAYGEDWEMWVRIATAYPVWYEPEPLALYRVRSNSLTSNSFRTGDNVRDYLRAIEICSTDLASVLPAEKASRLKRLARLNCAEAAIRRARRALHNGDFRSPLAQLRAALEASRAPQVMLGAGKLLLEWVAWAGINLWRGPKRLVEKER